jgi:hypothetical protein
MSTGHARRAVTDRIKPTSIEHVDRVRTSPVDTQ